MSDEPTESPAPTPPVWQPERFSPGDLKRGVIPPWRNRTPEMEQARREAIRKMFERWEAMPGDSEEDDREFFRAMDEANPGRFNLEKYYDHGPDPA